MATARLADRGIRALKVQAARVEVWDTKVRGLGLRVNPSGTKTWVYRYRYLDMRRRMRLGDYPALGLSEARDDALAARQLVAKGRDPVAERTASQRAAVAANKATFSKLAEEYIERHAKVKKRSWREDRRQLDRDLLPSWGVRPAASISRRDVILALDRKIDDGAPVAANRLRALISKVFSFGISRGVVEVNPAQHVERPANESPRERVLSEGEIRSVWMSLDEENPVTAGVYRLRLLTAQRGIEVASMRWTDIEDDWWTIPSAIVKNKRSHRVPLSLQTLDVLERLRSVTGSKAYVFASPTRPGQHVGRLPKATARIRSRSGVDFVPHDLRRTATSLMTGAGVSRLVVARILNHADSSVTAVYDRHSYDAEKRRALILWGDRLAAIVADREAPGRVVRIG